MSDDDIETAGAILRISLVIIGLLLIFWGISDLSQLSLGGKNYSVSLRSREWWYG